MINDVQAYLTTEQLAARYGLQPSTIKGWRIRKQGPPWYQLDRLGLQIGEARTRYRLADVLAWEQAQGITPTN